jgi:hypothetical protein
MPLARASVTQSFPLAGSDRNIGGKDCKQNSNCGADYFFTPKTASFAALATRNLTTVLAGILTFCCVFGLKPVRAFLFCFTSLRHVMVLRVVLLQDVLHVVRDLVDLEREEQLAAQAGYLRKRKPV